MLEDEEDEDERDTPTTPGEFMSSVEGVRAEVAGACMVGWLPPLPPGVAVPLLWSSSKKFSKSCHTWNKGRENHN